MTLARQRARDPSLTDALGRGFIALGALLAAAAIAMAAASAHAFPELGAAQRGWLETAIDYQKFHALGLILVGLLMQRSPMSRTTIVAGGLLLVGILLFCGSLYLRSLFGLHEVRRLTPAGGASFIMGWLLLAIGTIRGHGNTATT